MKSRKIFASLALALSAGLGLSACSSTDVTLEAEAQDQVQTFVDQYNSAFFDYKAAEHTPSEEVRKVLETIDPRQLTASEDLENKLAEMSAEDRQLITDFFASADPFAELTDTTDMTEAQKLANSILNYIGVNSHSGSSEDSGQSPSAEASDSEGRAVISDERVKAAFGDQQTPQQIFGDIRAIYKDGQWKIDGKTLYEFASQTLNKSGQSSAQASS